jgi:hypothetical protein
MRDNRGFDDHVSRWYVESYQTFFRLLSFPNGVFQPFIPIGDYPREADAREAARYVPGLLEIVWVWQ